MQIERFFMTSNIQRAQLQAQIWKIANEVRGAVDGWDFKQFVLGTLFYRFISENFTNYIEGGDESVDYANLPDSIITPEIKDDAIKTKGYFIYPSQFFVNIAKTANKNPNLKKLYLQQLRVLRLVMIQRETSKVYLQTLIPQAQD